MGTASFALLIMSRHYTISFLFLFSYFSNISTSTVFISYSTFVLKLMSANLILPIYLFLSIIALIDPTRNRSRSSIVNCQDYISLSSLSRLSFSFAFASSSGSFLTSVMYFFRYLNRFIYMFLKGTFFTVLATDFSN